MKLKVKIKGAKGVISGLKKMGKEIESIVKEEIDMTANNITDDARLNVPVHFGHLRTSIHPEISQDGLHASIGTNMKYAGYIEFGTGGKVDIPQGWEELAAQYRNGSGTFDDFKGNIMEWMKRKGIPEEAQWPVMMSILNNGITPHPFLYPAFEKNAPKMMERIRKEINWRISK